MAHLLLDIEGVDGRTPIGDAKFIETVVFDVAHRTQATVLNYMVHQFEPHGATAILMLAESHLSAHTWPENRSVHIDYYHCGGTSDELRAKLERAVDIFRQWLPATQYKTQILSRC